MPDQHITTENGRTARIDSTGAITIGASPLPAGHTTMLDEVAFDTALDYIRRIHAAQDANGQVREAHTDPQIRTNVDTYSRG